MTTAAYLYIGAILFVVGAFGTLVGASVVRRLVGVELMLAASTITFVATAAGLRELDGQVAALLIVVIAVAQAAVGFSIVARTARPQ